MGWVIAAIIVVLLFIALRLARLATRLDRLHRRTEAAWAALDVALARRSGVARAIAAASDDAPDLAAAVAEAARHTDSATVRSQRADAENALTKALEAFRDNGRLGGPVAMQLEEAAQRVLLARRFYNDAVRDTRALRSDRFTRMFGLAGTAALPDYFEIAEFNPAAPLSRVAARVVLIDDADRVLLHAGFDPSAASAEHWWFTPGGGVEQGEELAAAARRELVEETGVVVAADDLTGPLWWRREQFRFAGINYDQTEYFFVATMPRSATLSTDGFTDVERASIEGTRWWTTGDLRGTAEVVYPTELARRLPEALAVARGGRPPGDPIRIS